MPRIKSTPPSRQVAPIGNNGDMAPSTAFLQGGGSMEALIRAHDWDHSVVGPIAGWPQSLKTAISISLGSAFPMFIWWGLDELTNFYNDNYAVILGDKHPNALGLSGRQVWEEIWDDIGPLADKVMKTGESVFVKNFPLSVKRFGYEEETHFTFSYSPLRDDTGAIAGMYCAVVETTEEVKAAKQLKESEERFRNIADDAPVFIFLAGVNAEVEMLNRTWQEYTGIKGVESMGRAWVEITHPDDVEPATAIYMDGFNRRVSCSFENRQKGTDGRYRWILWKATPRFMPNGEFIGLMGIGIDIDDRKRLEQQKDEFIGIASHELKTPITSIKAYNQLLGMRFQKAQDDASAQLVTKMGSQLDRLTLLINDLLDVTKIEGGKLQFNAGTFNLNELITETVEEMQRLTNRQTIVATLQGNIAVTGDRDRIGQVLTNLLTNAIKYSPPGKNIQVKSRETPQMVEVSVQDYGEGIPQDAQLRVFERFYRVDGAKQDTYGGLGLGLYISQEIIARHNGTLQVSSTVGEGSVFSFKLPLQPDMAVPSRPAASGPA